MRILLLLLLAPAAIRAAEIVAAAPLILQIRVVDGDNATYPAGSRAIRGITVEVTDEAGQPVPHAALSFRLPEAGPSGLFANGTRTEIASSGPNGRATIWGMKWNRTPGAFTIRVTAAKGETRAGALIPQSLSDAVQAIAAKGDYKIRTGKRKRWIWLTALAAGAAGGGLALGSRSAGTPTTTAAAVGITIGNPTITVGR